MNNKLNFTKEEGVTILEITPDSYDVARIQMTVLLPRFLKAPYLIPGFLADMLTRGSVRYSKTAYTEKLEFLGAQVSLSTEGRYFHVTVTTREEALLEVLAILTDTLTHPLFLPIEIESLRKEYLQALHEEQDNARGLSYALFTRQIYDEQSPYYIPTLPEQQRELKLITTKLLSEAHETMRSSPWTVSMATSPKAAAALRTCIKKIHIEVPGQKDAMVTGEIAPKKTELQLVPEKQNIEFFIGNRLPLTLTDAEFLAFSVGLDVLGKRGGFVGRLMSIVREKEGLTYSIYAWIKNTTTTTHGLWHIWTFFTPKDTPKGISSTLREIKKISEKGITEIDLARFKELLCNQFLLAHESMRSVLSLYHAGITSGRTPEDIQSYPERVKRLTRVEVNRALKRYMKPESLVITGAGPTDKLVEKI